MKFFTFFQFIPHTIAYFKYDSNPWENLAEFLTKILDIYWYSTFSDLFSTAITAEIFLSLLLAARCSKSRRQQRRTLLATCDACSRLTAAWRAAAAHKQRTSRCSTELLGRLHALKQSQSVRPSSNTVVAFFSSNGNQYILVGTPFNSFNNF